VIPFSLRRFGAALVCSLAIVAPAAPPALATEPAAPAAKPGPAAKPAPVASDSGAPTSILRAREEAEREGRRNGARSKAADGTLVVWDNVNSVWVAAGSKNTYWVDERYYRFDEGVWLTSKLLAGPWEITRQHLVPEAPRDRHAPPKDSVTASLPSGLEAIYEPRLKVFKIGGRKGIFLHDGLFYRYDGGVWLESGVVDGPWTPTSSVALPQSLRRALAPPEKGSRVTLPSGDVLVSEGQPNLFAVDGRPDALYFDGAFYERRNQKWFKSASLASEWEEISSQKIPGTVRSNYHLGGKIKPGDKKKASAKAGKAGDNKSAKKPGRQDAAKKKADAAKAAEDEEAE